MSSREVDRRIFQSAAAITLTAAISAALFSGCRGNVSPSGAADVPQIAAPQAASAAETAGQELRQTLDPNLFQGKVRQAYEVAAKHPALLAQLHCYCGCDKTDGHTSLLDCYRDTHGSNCAICVGEAVDAEQLAAQGVPVSKIRDILRERYAHGE